MKFDIEINKKKFSVESEIRPDVGAVTRIYIGKNQPIYFAHLKEILSNLEEYKKLFEKIKSYKFLE